MSLAEQHIPSRRSFLRCALTHPHANCLPGHPSDRSFCRNAAYGKAAQQEVRHTNGKSNKRYIQRGLKKPLLKALCNMTFSRRHLSRRTETKRNPLQQLFPLRIQTAKIFSKWEQGAGGEPLVFSSAVMQTRPQNHAPNPGICKSLSSAHQETHKIFIWAIKRGSPIESGEYMPHNPSPLAAEAGSSLLSCSGRRMKRDEHTEHRAAAFPKNSDYPPRWRSAPSKPAARAHQQAKAEFYPRVPALCTHCFAWDKTPRKKKKKINSKSLQSFQFNSDILHKRFAQYQPPIRRQVFSVFPWCVQLMVVSSTLIISTPLIDINYIFLKVCGSFQQRPSLCRPTNLWELQFSAAQRAAAALAGAWEWRVPGKAPAHVQAGKQEVQTKHGHSQKPRWLLLLLCTWGCGETRGTGGCGD